MARGRSLHIGVSKDANGKLPFLSAENDARFMRDLAKKQEFTPTTLSTAKDADGDPTRENVLREIRDAAKDLKSGDMFLLSYNGHGDRYTDKLGHICYWHLYDQGLTSDDLYRAWGEFQPGVRIFYTSDSCYSGTMGTSWLPRACGFMVSFVRQVHRFIKLPLTLRRAAAIEASCLLISACQDNKTASCDPKRNHGFFTEALLSVWNEGTFQGDYKKFSDDIKVRLASLLEADPAYQPPQDPNCKVFGKGSFEGQRPFTINPETKAQGQI